MRRLVIGLQDNRRKFSDNEKQVLFDEVHGRCPICGRRLTHSKNGHFYRTFEVAHIYPANPKTEEEKLLATEERLSDDVNSLKNVVAVCRICHKKFDTPRTIDERIDCYLSTDLRTARGILWTLSLMKRWTLQKPLSMRSWWTG